MNDPTRNAETKDDELLCALLDNELSPADADALTERLAREPALAQRLEALRSADDNVRELFARVDELPMPKAVLDLLDDASTDGAAAEHAASNVIAFPRRFLQSFAQAPVAIAASVALAAGFFVDRLLDEEPAVPSGLAALQAHAVPQASDLHALLEDSASARPVKLADGSEGRVVLTFADTAGDWCRQLSISNAATSVQALACRRDGGWQSELIAFGEPSVGGYQQASSTTSPAISSAVDLLIGDGEPLDSEQEADLIQNQWQKNP